MHNKMLSLTHTPYHSLVVSEKHSSMGPQFSQLPLPYFARELREFPTVFFWEFSSKLRVAVQTP